MTSSEPARVALVGCGAVAEVLHAPTLRTLAAEGLVEVAALVDPNPARSAQVARLLPRARRFSDLGAALADARPDLAIVATPHQTHADIAARCLDAGAHVLCEKPLASSVAACDRVIAAAERAGRVLAVGHVRRFFPACQVIKEVLDAGLLGPVRTFRFLEGETYSWPAQSASYFRRAEAGGGVLMDVGAHALDLLLWWLGDVANVDYADDAMGGVEATCRARFAMASGAEGIVRLSRDWPLADRYVIECERGWLAWRCGRHDAVEWGLRDSAYGLAAQVHRLASATPARGRTLGPPVGDYMDCFAAQVRDVIAAMRQGRAPRVPGEAGRAVVALIERCYRSRALLETPWLDQAERARARQLAGV